MRILCVDDDPIFLSLLTVSLNELGYDDLILCGSGEETLERLDSRDDVDVFLLDVDMDGMDGIELGKRIRKLPRYRDAVIIMVTARRDQPTIHAAFRLGASGYVTKPISLKALGSCLVDAATIRNRNVALSDARRSAIQPGSPQGMSGSPYTQVEFSSIQNVVSLPAMMNYLSSISQKMIMDSMSLKFQVPEYTQLRATMSPEEYHPLLADAAESISLALRTVDPMITYTGGGQFVVVMKRTAASVVGEMSRLANDILQKVQSEVAGPARTRISIAGSEPYIPRTRPTEERTCLLSGASAQSIIV